MNNFLSVKKWTQSSKNKNNESLIETCENDPDYEVVEFVKVNPINDSFYNEPKPLSEQIKNEICHFCPNNVPAAVYCLDCDRLSFCEQCDLIFHKHPKRADHKRKIKLEQFKPPLPPKQMTSNPESQAVLQAPLPPPRRNKLQTPIQQSLSHGQQTGKNNTLIRSSKLQPSPSSFSTFSLTKKLSNFFLNNHGSCATLDRKSVSKTNLTKVSSVDHNRYLDWRKNINNNNSKYRSQLLFNGNSVTTTNVENRLDEFKRFNSIQTPITNSCSVMDLSQNFQYPPQNFALNGFNQNPWMINNGYPYPRAQWHPQIAPLVSTQNNCMMHSCCGSTVSLLNECEKKPFSKLKKVSTSNLSNQSSRRNFSCLSDLSSSPSSSSSENVAFDDTIRLRTNTRTQNRNRNSYKNRNRKPPQHRNGNGFGSRSTLSTSESRKKSYDCSSSSYDDKFAKTKPTMNHWKCKYCTFMNKQNSNVCVMCSKTHFNFEKEKISSRSSSSSMNGPENRAINPLKIGEQQKNAVTKELSDIVSSLISLRLNEIEKQTKIKDSMKYSELEMEIAKSLNESSNEEDLIQWLKTDWIEMIKNVQSLVTKHLDNFVRKGKGNSRSKPVTFECAKSALIDNKGNILSAINQCIENQTKKVLS